MRGVTVPGIFGSDELHWQSRWEAADAELVRFSPSSWDEPDRDDWREAVVAAVAAAGPDAIVVAHSLGCLAVLDALATGRVRCAGVFLVSPPDVDGPNFPAPAASFRGIRPTTLSVPALAVAADDDPYSAWPMTVAFVGALDVDLIGVGSGGHLNSASGLGDWPEGRRLLTAFAAGARRRSGAQGAAARARVATADPTR